MVFSLLFLDILAYDTTLLSIVKFNGASIFDDLSLGLVAIGETQRVLSSLVLAVICESFGKI